MNDDPKILREVVEQTYDLTDVCPRYGKEVDEFKGQFDLIVIS